MHRMLCNVRPRQQWIPFLIIVIAAVSLYDTYLILRFSDHINQLEENPVGRWLLQLGGGRVEVFVRAKLAGTLIVLSSLTGMRIYRSRLAVPVTASVATYQVVLLVYLTIVDLP